MRTLGIHVQRETIYMYMYVHACKFEGKWKFLTFFASSPPSYISFSLPITLNVCGLLCLDFKEIHNSCGCRVSVFSVTIFYPHQQCILPLKLLSFKGNPAFLIIFFFPKLNLILISWDKDMVLRIG